MSQNTQPLALKLLDRYAAALPFGGDDCGRILQIAMDYDAKNPGGHAIAQLQQIVHRQLDERLNRA